MQVEANLHGQSRFFHITFENYIKVTEYNTGNVAARLQMSKSINVIFYIFDFRQDLTCAIDSYTQTLVLLFVSQSPLRR